MIEKRKIQVLSTGSANITLPRDWLERHRLEKSDVVDMHYTANSVLMLNPENRELTELEGLLVDLLMNLPSYEMSQRIVEKLKTIVNQFEA